VYKEGGPKGRIVFVACVEVGEGGRKGETIFLHVLA
jgi:hypothetical protein